MISIALIILLASHHCYAQETEISKDAVKINLSNQGITELTSFDEYDHLEEIDLSQNKLTKLDRNIFASNHKLKRIDLSDNGFLEIPQIGPFLITSTKFLNLTNCNIKIIPGNSFDEMINLKTLDLTGNPIKFEESTQFIKNVNPGTKIIVTNISEEDLKSVCKIGETLTILIKDKESVVNCKTFNISPEEKLSEKKELQQEIEDNNMQMVEENGIIENSEELEMLADQAGSGEEEITSEDSNVSSNENITDEEKNPEGSDKNESEEITTTEETIISVEDNIDDEHHEVSPSDVMINTASTVSIKEKDDSEDSTDIHEEDTSDFSVEVDKKITGVSEVVGRNTSESKPPRDQIDNNPNIKKEEPVLNRTVLKSSLSGKPQEDVVDKEQERSVNSSNDSGNDEKTKADASTTDTANIGNGATSIILMVIVGVVLLGGILVGYKYWKNRKEDEYSVVDTKDPSQGSEDLLDVKVDKNNHENKPERLPLMLCSQGNETEKLDIDKVKHEYEEISAKDAITDSNNSEIPDIDASIVNIPEATNKSE